MADQTRHGKSNPEIQRMLDTVLKRRGLPSEGPLIGPYMALFTDPHGALAKEIFDSMPPEEQKELMDEIEATIKVNGWNFLRPQKKPPADES